MAVEKSILERLIAAQVAALGRPDLFRAPIFAYSDAADPRYHELKTLIGPWHLDPAELMPDARSVISYFVPFTKEVARAPRAAAHGAPVWGEAYLVINDGFDRIGESVGGYLAAEGFAAHPISGTHTYDPKDLRSMWSHRSAAAIAGLGTFGANRLLITARGSAGRFCTILTDAPLAPSCATAPPRCPYEEGRCGACFRACPVGALRPGAFDRFVCHDDVLLRNAEALKGLGFCDVCGKCIAVCPLACLE